MTSLMIEFLSNFPQRNESTETIISTSLHKSRAFVDEDVDHKNLFPSAMYAHLCHSEVDSPDDDRSSSKRILHYYPQPHQFQAVNTRASPPKTPFSLTATLFPSTQQIYNGHHHMSNLHEGNYYCNKSCSNPLSLHNPIEYLNNEYRLNRDMWTQESTVIEDSLG